MKSVYVFMIAMELMMFGFGAGVLFERHHAQKKPQLYQFDDGKRRWVAPYDDTAPVKFVRVP